MMKFNDFLIESGNHPGLMIAYQVPLDIAEKLAIPGGESPEDLHVTIIYLGKEINNNNILKIKNMVRNLCQREYKFPGFFSKLDTFPPSEPSDEKTVLFAKCEAVGLHGFRQKVLKGLKKIGIAFTETFPVYQPHCTLAYIPQTEKVEFPSFAPLHINIDGIGVYSGRVVSQYPLKGD